MAGGKGRGYTSFTLQQSSLTDSTHPKSIIHKTMILNNSRTSEDS